MAYNENKKMSFISAGLSVLLEEGREMHYNEITKIAFERYSINTQSETHKKTPPEKTIFAVLSAISLAETSTLKRYQSYHIHKQKNVLFNGEIIPDPENIHFTRPQKGYFAATYHGVLAGKDLKASPKTSPNVVSSERPEASPRPSAFSKDTRSPQEVAKDWNNKVKQSLIDHLQSLGENKDEKGKKLEEHITNLLKKGRMLNEVTNTRLKRDGGIDITGKDAWGETIIIQVKNQKGNVSINTLKELVGTMTEHKCSRGVFITTGDFVNTAGNYKEKVERDGKTIKLVNGDDLFDWHKKHEFGIIKKEVEIMVLKQEDLPT